MNFNEQKIQERLDKADPFLIEYLITCSDEKLMELADQKKEQLISPLLKHSHTTRDAINEYIAAIQDVMGLRTIAMLRKKEKESGIISEIENKGISIS